MSELRVSLTAEEWASGQWVAQCDSTNRLAWVETKDERTNTFRVDAVFPTRFVRSQFSQPFSQS